EEHQHHRKEGRHRQDEEARAPSPVGPRRRGHRRIRHRVAGEPALEAAVERTLRHNLTRRYDRGLGEDPGAPGSWSRMPHTPLGEGPARIQTLRKPEGPGAPRRNARTGYRTWR